MDLLNGLYVLTAVFGVGVLLIDVMGLLGDGDSDGDIDGAYHNSDGDHGGSGASHSLLSILGKIRMAVYFCFGFGLLGLAAGSMGYGAVGGLAWAIPGGIASALLANAFVRFQQRDVDSSLKEDELLGVKAEVLVTMTNTDMGRIRTRKGQFNVERYALAEEPNSTFSKGDTVEIVRISDDCVYVRAASQH